MSATGRPYNAQDGDWQGSKLYLIDQNEQSCEINLNYLWIEGQGANADNTIDPNSSNFIDMDVISVGNGIIDIILVDSQDHFSTLPRLDTQGRLVRVTINLNYVDFQNQDFAASATVVALALLLSISVLDQYTRRITGFAIHAYDCDGIIYCRLFNQTISGQPLPKYLSPVGDAQSMILYFCFTVSKPICELLV